MQHLQAPRVSGPSACNLLGPAQTVVGYRGEVVGQPVSRLCATLAFAQHRSAAVPYARRAGEGQARLTTATLAFERPLVLSCSLIDFSELAALLPAEKVLGLLVRHAEHAIRTDAYERFCEDHPAPESATAAEEVVRWSTHESFLDDGCIVAYVLLDDALFVQELAALGIDGAIHRGNGVTMDCLEYRIFSLGQILSLTNVPL